MLKFYKAESIGTIKIMLKNDLEGGSKCQMQTIFSNLLKK